MTLPDHHHNHALFRFSSGHLASILVSVMVAGLIGSFSLLWSMSHSLIRISDRLESLSNQLQSLNNAQSVLSRELALLDRRLSLLEQKVGSRGPE